MAGEGEIAWAFGDEGSRLGSIIERIAGQFENIPLFFC